MQSGVRISGPRPQLAKILFGHVLGVLGGLIYIPPWQFTVGTREWVFLGLSEVLVRNGSSNFLGDIRRSLIKIGLNPGLVLPRKRLRKTPSVASSRFVFIVGLHRSGTTILHNLLREHPETSGFEGTWVPRDEGQFLQSVFKADSAFGGPGRFAFDSAAHLTEDSLLATPGNRDKLLRQWGAYYDLNKRLLLEKSPANILSTRFLQELFPDARFVCIVRHPIPVGLSTHNWTKHSGMSLADVMPHWVKAHRTFLNDVGHLRNSKIIRYEDLVADPASAISRVQRFLGLSEALPQRGVASHNEKYFARWLSEVEDKDAIIRSMENLGGAELFEQLGYRWDAPFKAEREVSPSIGIVRRGDDDEALISQRGV